MNTSQGIKKTCVNGHTFYKSSDCPVCPLCAQDERVTLQKDFPQKLGAPALRALSSIDVQSLKQLTKYTEKDIADLHGMGPKGIMLLKQALAEKSLHFQPK